MHESNFQKPHEEIVPLSKSAEFLLNECRMVLPGIQALFGFQLIAVFNSGFSQLLSGVDQKLHLFALVLTAISIAFVMAPAAYHRQTGTHEVSNDFLKLASNLLLLGMFPLMVAICIDVYLVVQIFLEKSVAVLITLCLTMLFVLLWYIIPQLRKHTLS